MEKYELFISKTVYVEAENKRDAVEKYVNDEIRDKKSLDDVNDVGIFEHEMIKARYSRIVRINETSEDKPTIHGKPVRYEGEYLVLEDVIIEDVDGVFGGVSCDKVKVALDEIDDINDEIETICLDNIKHDIAVEMGDDDELFVF